MVLKIISGGQTGADRAALDFAIAHEIPHGGKCPAGRTAEDGPLDPKYQLTETAEKESIHRTRANVRESDGTVVFTEGPLEGGSRVTADYALKQGKPCIHLDLRAFPPTMAAEHLKKWIEENKVRVLNVAGPRASHAPDIYKLATKTLEAALQS
jgi:hypothetical protein